MPSLRNYRFKLFRLIFEGNISVLKDRGNNLLKMQSKIW